MFGLRSDYLNSLTAQALKTKKNWQGVYPCDDFKKCVLQDDQLYICNLSSKKAISGGTHYIAICIKNNNIYYFDSYGYQCYDTNILESMKKSGKNIIYSKVSIQHVDSYFCGFFSLAFLLLSEQYLNPIDLINSCFNTKNLIRNEIICINMIKNSLNKISLLENLSQ